MSMIVPRKIDITGTFVDSSAIDAALEQAGRDAHLRHKRLGVPIVVIPRDGIIVDPPAELAASPNPEP
jgi:hypothetical protein